MVMIIEGKSQCLLCQEVLDQNKKYTSYPAFLPRDHRYGRFSDAAFHTECFINDPDHEAVEDMLTAYKMILKSRPYDLKSMEQILTWEKEAFSDWPPKNGVVIFHPLDEDSEEGSFYMDADQYADMVKVEEEYEKQQEERRKYEQEHRWDGWRDD
jgi:hypothetical protein